MLNILQNGQVLGISLISGASDSQPLARCNPACRRLAQPRRQGLATCFRLSASATSPVTAACEKLGHPMVLFFMPIKWAMKFLVWCQYMNWVHPLGIIGTPKTMLNTNTGATHQARRTPTMALLSTPNLLQRRVWSV